MINTGPATVVIVPGLRDHIADHWQTLLEPKLARFATVPRMDRDKLSCAAWVAALDRTLADVKGAVVLVAHSAGCMIVVHWARVAQRAIHGALLATPPDFESPLPAGYPTLETLRDHGWLPTPRERLPFPSIVAASTNDPLGRIDRVETLAGAWGSRFVNIGSVGHLNPAAGYGEWSGADAFIEALCAAPANRMQVVRQDATSQTTRGAG